MREWREMPSAIAQKTLVHLSNTRVWCGTLAPIHIAHFHIVRFCAISKLVLPPCLAQYTPRSLIYSPLISKPPLRRPFAPMADGNGHQYYSAGSPFGFPPLFISIGQQGGDPNGDIW